MKPVFLFLCIVSLFFISACGSAGEDRTFAGGGATGGNTNTGTPAPTPSPADESNNAPPAATPTPASISSVRISSFIWKPESERDQKLVILVNPTNVRIVVTGSLSETLRNSGPSNGFGTTGRGSFSGCSYGTNIEIEFFDSRGLRILTAGGRNSLSIPRGCERFQF